MDIESYNQGAFGLKESEAACADPDVVSKETDPGRWSPVDNA